MKSTLDFKNRFLSLYLFILSIIALSSCGDILSTENELIDGTWTCKEVHDDLGTRSYYIEIEYLSTDSSQIYIYNFLGLSNDITPELRVIASISGNNISIPTQDIDGHEVTGSGKIEADYNTITLNYTDLLYDSPWNVSATYSRID